MMEGKMKTVYGIGNPLIDVIVNISEEELKEMVILADAFGHILIVGPDQGITEIP